MVLVEKLTVSDEVSDEVITDGANVFATVNDSPRSISRGKAVVCSEEARKGVFVPSGSVMRGVEVSWRVDGVLEMIWIVVDTVDELVDFLVFFHNLDSHQLLVEVVVVVEREVLATELAVVVCLVVLE